MPLATALSLSLVFHGGLIALTMNTSVAVSAAVGAVDEGPVIVFETTPVDEPRRPPVQEPPPPPAEAAKPAPLERLPPPPPPPADEMERLVLGIDDGDPSSPNWIGYRDYLEHFAPLSETEQAARRLEAGGDEGRAIDPTPPVPPSMAPVPVAPQPSPALPPQPTRTSTPPAPQVPAQRDPAPTSDGQERKADGKGERPFENTNENPNDKDAKSTPDPAATGPFNDATKPAVPETPFPTDRPSEAITPAPPAPVETPAPIDPTMRPGERDLPRIDGPLPDPTLPPLPLPGFPTPQEPTAIPEGRPQPTPQPAPRPETVGGPSPAAFVGPPFPLPLEPQPNTQPDLLTPPQVSPSPNETPAAPQPPTQPVSQPQDRATPATPGQKAKDSAGDGEITDSESDPTSVVSVPPNVWRNGRPVAAKGLTIKTRKPKFTILTLVTQAPRNPTVEIQFDHEGKPVDYRFEVSAGHPDVDGPILDAVAAWRASGKPLEKLGPKDTITVRIRLLLVQ
jgi:hypothetical protein